MATNIWWCKNCGYETDSPGQCADCGEPLSRAPLTELEPGAADEEVAFGIYQWDATSLARLIDELVEQRVPHRFEGQELVVRSVDEDKADAAVAHVQQSQARRRTKQLAYVTSRDGQVTPVWEVRTDTAPGALPYRREAPTRWNGLAIASFVIALVPALPFVAPIVSIVLGLVGHRQATERNERGRGLAKWGIIIAVASLALSVVWIYQVARHAMS
jgi:hypothetical protein